MNWLFERGQLGCVGKSVVGAETIMMKNGLCSLAAAAIDGVDVEVGGVLILQDGRLLGGDSYVYYTGTYECSDGKWKGDMTSQEHTPTTRPMVERVQPIRFSGYLQRRRCRSRCHRVRWQATYPIRCNIALSGGGSEAGRLHARQGRIVTDSRRLVQKTG